MTNFKEGAALSNGNTITEEFLSSATSKDVRSSAIKSMAESIFVDESPVVSSVSPVPASKKSVWDKEVDIRVLGAKFKGELKPLGIGGFCILGGLCVYGLGKLAVGLVKEAFTTNNDIIKDNVKTANEIGKEAAASQNRVNEGKAEAENTIAVDDNKTANEIEKMKAKADANVSEYAGKLAAKADYEEKHKTFVLNRDGIVVKAPAQTANLGKSGATFEKNFCKRHPFPELPDYLKPIFAGVPKGFENSMLVHHMSMFGALCFSRVRATYLDGKQTGPNLHVMVTGDAGSGKSKFDDIFNFYFEDVIADESFKSQINDSSRRIFQVIGTDITESRLVMLLSDNQGTHLYIIETEISDACENLKTKGGLTYTDIRKSLNGECVSHMTREKGSPQGKYPINLNSTLTGTPVEVKKLFKDQIESGTAQRFCFTYIPSSEKELPRLDLPDGEAKDFIRNQISEWRDKYCYTVGSCSGDETPCEITEADLSYLHGPLKNWLKGQCNKSNRESDCYLKQMRMAIYKRRANIAFNCGIVLHMMWGQPTDETTRQKVVDACLYIADYITENYIFTVSTMERGYYRNIPTATTQNSGRRMFKDEEIAEMAALHRQFNEKGQHIYGWDTLAAMYNTSFSTVSRKVKEYEKNHGNDND